MSCRIVLLLSVAALSAGCNTAPNRAAPPMYQGASNNSGSLADDRLDATVWSQTAIEHDLVYREIYRLAEEKLLKALADPDWDALPKGEREGKVGKLAPAVIVDVDETVLDNSPFQARLIRDNGQFNALAWNAWCNQRSARALAGAKEFAEFAAQHGVTLFYLTNRDDALTDATRDNLKARGFPLSPTETTVLGKGSPTPGCVASAGDKGCRRKLVAGTHRVLLMFGDQLGDFVDGSSASVAARAKAAEAYSAWFGERWFALPNPDYGSWQDAVVKFADDPKLKSDARAAKRAALRVE